LLRLINILLL